MIKKALFSIVLLIFIYACNKPGTTGTISCSYNYCGLTAPDSESVRINFLIDSLGLKDSGFVKDCSGLYYHIIDTGVGNFATACNTVVVNYFGKFPGSATNFDSSTITYPLNALISGWIDGVHLIKTGGHIQLFIPPALGYGYADYQGIPAKSYLYFDIRLLQIQ